MNRKERSHDYYMRNREKKLAYMREYYRAHREQVIMKVRECQKRRVEREKRKLLIKN